MKGLKKKIKELTPLPLDLPEIIGYKDQKELSGIADGYILRQALRGSLVCAVKFSFFYDEKQLFENVIICSFISSFHRLVGTLKK